MPDQRNTEKWMECLHVFKNLFLVSSALPVIATIVCSLLPVVVPPVWGASRVFSYQSEALPPRSTKKGETNFSKQNFDFCAVVYVVVVVVNRVNIWLYLPHTQEVYLKPGGRGKGQGSATQA